MIDPRRELARREAMNRLRQRIAVTNSIFGPKGHRARVLVDDVYFDVSPGELASLKSGRTVEDLGLEASADQED